MPSIDACLIKRELFAEAWCFGSCDCAAAWKALEHGNSMEDC